MQLYLEKCNTYEYAAVEKHISTILSVRFPGISDFSGKRVFIKVNGLTKATAEQAMTTHPTLVAAAAKWFILRGAEVRIGDNPAGIHDEAWLRAVYRAAGYEEAAQKTGAELTFDREIIERSCDGECCQTFRVCNMALDRDIFINIAKLKTHEYTRYTGCVKNLYGTLPAEQRSALHAQFKEVNDFSNMLVDLYQCIAPDLSILDAVMGMEGSGPSAGEPREIGVLIASDNAHDVDYVGARLIGMRPEEVKTLENAIRRGLVTMQEDAALAEKIAQLSVKNFKMPANSANSLSNRLPKPVYRFLSRHMKKYPQFDKKKCVSCGICVKNCPQGALRLDGKPVFDQSKCICCYCCQEMCPKKAIDLKDTFVTRALTTAKRIYRKIR